jgi:hypothetical protein
MAKYMVSFWKDGMLYETEVEAMSFQEANDLLLKSNQSALRPAELAVDKMERAAKWLHEHGFKRAASEPLDECVVARNGSVEIKFDGEVFVATELDTMVCGPKCKDPEMAIEGLEKFFSDHAERVRKVRLWTTR